MVWASLHGDEYTQDAPSAAFPYCVFAQTIGTRCFNGAAMNLYDRRP